MSRIQRLLSSAGILAIAGARCAAQAATIVISSRDAPGVGFNDPTPVAPVGGNTGTTLGEQRLIVYRHVADLWEAAIAAPVTITVSAGWEALACTATGAVLGSASAWNIWHDFPNGMPGTWYPQALANKLAGINLSEGNPDDGSGFGNVDIKTQFNVNLGNPGCLDGTRFYLGLDDNEGSSVDFVTTLLHEIGHGLGFSVLTVQTSTGFRVNADGRLCRTAGLPSIWEGFMLDNTSGKTWLQMTSERAQALGDQSAQARLDRAASRRRRGRDAQHRPSLRVSTPMPESPASTTTTRRPSDLRSKPQVRSGSLPSFPASAATRSTPRPPTSCAARSR